MASPKVDVWNAVDLGPLTELAVRAVHQPPGHFRISRSRYDAGVEFRGAARAGLIYILSGSCRYEWASGAAELESPQYVDAPAGEYRFAVRGASVCELMHVWLLPPEFRVPPEAETPSDA